VQVITQNKSLLIPATLTIMHFALCMVFYLIRNINKAKLDLDDGEIELDDGDLEYGYDD
jgi:hypothetical protein